MPHQGEPVTTEEDVAILLENFTNYHNTMGVEDPWFTLDEINQQFAWTDIPHDKLRDWLDKLIFEGRVDTTDQDGEAVYRWLS